MYSPPRIMFHSPAGHNWDERNDPALRRLGALNEAPRDLLPSLAINVSQPRALMVWLERNNAALISDLWVFVDAWSDPSAVPDWCRLFDVLRQKATNIRTLNVYWDAEGPWGTRKPWYITRDYPMPGLGMNLAFVRGLGGIKVQSQVDLGGFYAKHWPRYLEEMMCLRPVNT